MEKLQNRLYTCTLRLPPSILSPHCPHRVVVPGARSPAPHLIVRHGQDVYPPYGGRAIPEYPQAHNCRTNPVPSHQHPTPPCPQPFVAGTVGNTKNTKQTPAPGFLHPRPITPARRTCILPRSPLSAPTIHTGSPNTSTSHAKGGRRKGKGEMEAASPSALMSQPSAQPPEPPSLGRRVPISPQLQNKPHLPWRSFGSGTGCPLGAGARRCGQSGSLSPQHLNARTVYPRTGA
jgi:hypothetical protein